MDNVKFKEEAKIQLDSQIKQIRSTGQDVYSYSGATGYELCPLSYHRSHTRTPEGKRDEGVNNIYALVGGALHDALETIYDGGENHLQEAFDDILIKCRDQNINFPNEGIRTTYLVEINHWIKHFKKHELKSVNEMPFMIEYKGNKIRGFVDQITRDPNSNIDSVRILDYKTSTKYVGKTKKEHGRQLVLYAYAIEQILGVKVTSICWDFLKYVKVEYKGKTRKRSFIFPRSSYVMAFKDEILDCLEEEGVPKIAAIDIFTQALKDLEIPKQIEHMFELSPALVEYTYDEETKQETLDYLNKMIVKIKEETEWKAPPRHKFGSLFFCNNLCNYRLDCIPLKAMKEGISEEHKQAEFKRLFNKK